MLNKLTLSQARQALGMGRISSVDLVSACLERIANREPDVHAWSFIDGEAALRQAQECDRVAVHDRGLFHGIALGIKDVIDTVDMPTAYGSPIYANHRPAWDAYCVTAIKRAGGIILGKHATSEFAYARPATTVNPHNFAHTPGGSSGGSAAAVADYMVPVAISTQTGGSTIRPAAYCGVVGFKPSFGLVNRAGLKSLAESLDTIGIMARCVDDIQLTMQVLAGVEPTLGSLSRPPVVAFCKTPHWEQVDGNYQTHLNKLTSILAQRGALIKNLDLLGELQHQYDDQRLIMNYEGARALAYERTAFADKLSDSLREELDAGANINYSQYSKVLRETHAARHQINAMLRGIDFLITPSASGPAPHGQASAGSSLFNRNWSLLGLPCITLPTGKNEGELPYGTQLVGAYGRDAPLLAWARWVEETVANSIGGIAAPA